MLDRRALCHFAVLPAVIRFAVLVGQAEVENLRRAGYTHTFEMVVEP
jgi:hypothetical protein